MKNSHPYTFFSPLDIHLGRVGKKRQVINVHTVLVDARRRNKTIFSSFAVLFFFFFLILQLETKHNHRRNKRISHPVSVCDEGRFDARKKKEEIESKVLLYIRKHLFLRCHAPFLSSFDIFFSSILVHSK